MPFEFILVLIFSVAIPFAVYLDKERRLRESNVLNDLGFSFVSEDVANRIFKFGEFSLLSGRLTRLQKHIVGRSGDLDVCVVNLITMAIGLHQPHITHTVVVVRGEAKLPCFTLMPKENVLDLDKFLSFPGSLKGGESLVAGYSFFSDVSISKEKFLADFLQKFLNNEKRLYIQSNGNSIMYFEWAKTIVSPESYSFKLKEAASIYRMLAV